MPSLLSGNQQADSVHRGVSRRSFGRIAAVLGAGAALPFYNEQALAQLSLGEEHAGRCRQDQRQ